MHQARNIDDVFVIFMSSRSFSLSTSLMCLLNSFADSSFIYVLPSLTPFCLSNSQSQTKYEKGPFFMASVWQVLNRCDNFSISSLRKMVSVLRASFFCLNGLCSPAYMTIISTQTNLCQKWSGLSSQLCGTPCISSYLPGWTWMEPPMSNRPALRLLSPAMGGQLSNLG